MKNVRYRERLQERKKGPVFSAKTERLTTYYYGPVVLKLELKMGPILAHVDDPGRAENDHVRSVV